VLFQIDRQRSIEGHPLINLPEAKRLAAHKGWLADVPAEFREAVLSRSLLLRFKAGELIHFAGDQSAGMYGLLQGTVRVLLSADEHGPYFGHLLRPGTWFGEGPAITGQPRPVSLKASGETALLYLSQSDIAEIAQLNPTYWRFFVIPLMEHLNVALGAVADLMIRDHAKRLLAVLLRLGGCRTGHPTEEIGPIEVDVSQNDLAGMANVARMTASATLRKLTNAGFVELGYGRVLILAPERLREMLAE
jgi:CRP-like cAMP-binding protein